MTDRVAKLPSYPSPAVAARQSALGHARARLRAVTPERDAPVAPPERRRLGAYRLTARLGSGAVGDVFKAEHVLLGREVAIKVLRPEFENDTECVERFLAEARAVNLVEHDNIVDVCHLSQEADGTTWYVMELLDGQDLASILATQPVPLERALAIARQLCEALTAVHKAGIIHRDIKPENIFVVKRDGEEAVKLLDFGIAYLPGPTQQRDSERRLVFGTPPYLAPEQACAEEGDHRCDLYAVGAVLFELITGRLLFARNSVEQLLAAAACAPPPVLAECTRLPGCVRVELDHLVSRCLAKDAEARPESAREIADTLAGLENALRTDERLAYRADPLTAVHALLDHDTRDAIAPIEGTPELAEFRAASRKAPKNLIRLALAAGLASGIWAAYHGGPARAFHGMFDDPSPPAAEAEPAQH